MAKGSRTKLGPKPASDLLLLDSTSPEFACLLKTSNVLEDIFLGTGRS